MDLRQFKYFVAIVDHASLSKAASHLFVAQPALSQHVRRMEEELQVSLLYRTSRGVVATDEGRRLYLHAKRLLALAGETADTVRDAVINPSGVVRIGMSATAGELLGVRLIRAAGERYPNLRLHPIEAPDTHLLRWLRRGDVDLAILHSVGEADDLDSQPLLTERVLLCGAAGRRGEALPDPVPIELALGLTLILPGQGNGLRTLVDGMALRFEQSQAQPRYEIDSYAQIKQLALAGLGYALLPESNVQRERSSGAMQCQQLGDPPVRRRVDLLHSRERHLPAAARVVQQLVANLVRELVVEGVWQAEVEPDRMDLQL